MNFYAGRCKIEITALFAVSVTAMLMCDRTGIFLFILSAVVLHESGHALAAVVFRRRIILLRMAVFGIEMRVENTSNIFLEFTLAAAGVVINFFSAALFYLLFLHTGNKIFSAFAAANTALGLFNSLPVNGLDGGDLLKIFLDLFFSENTAQKIRRLISLMIITTMTATGIYMSIKKSNPTLLLFCVYSVICKL